MAFRSSQEPETNLLDLMNDALDEYAAGGSDLSALVDDLGSLIDELQTDARADAPRIAQLRAQWTSLAVIRADVRGRQDWRLSDPETAMANEALVRLRSLIGS